MIKKILYVLIFLASSTFCKAQFYRSVAPSPDFTKALEKIILDFRQNFKTIQGENISTGADVDAYVSTVELPGSLSSMVYQYHSQQDTSASWQATMYQGDDYKEASKVYETCVRLVKKSNVRWLDASSIGFSGEVVRPSEDLRFVMSILHLNLDDVRYKNFVAEIEMVSLYDRWEVRVNLHTKKPDSSRRF